MCIFYFIFFCFSLLCSFYPLVMSAVLQTPPHSQCSELCCMIIPPVGAFVCMRTHAGMCVCIRGGGLPLFVGVCVFKKVSEDGCLCSYLSVCLRVRDGESECGATASVQL